MAVSVAFSLVHTIKSVSYELKLMWFHSVAADDTVALIHTSRMTYC